MRVDIESNYKKFRQGDIVKVASKMPPSMQHFHHDCLAIVVEYNSIGDSLGLLLVYTPSNNTDDNYLSYSAWYYEDQITLIDDDLVIQGEIEALLEDYNRR